MGKDWYRTIANSSEKSSKNTPPSSLAKSTSGGCLNAIFHFFDFHHLQFCIHQPHQTHSTVLKGMEAPRNSLELESEEEDEDSEVTVLSSSKQNEKLHFPGLQIKTTCDGDGRRSTSVDSSPATKTPTLVARLMGLDLLPDGSSPSTPNSSTKKSHLRRRRNRQVSVPGSRSLPETPRVSSSSSRRSVDADPRLSLQVNAYAESLTRKRSDIKCRDENRRSSEYARQVLKQVKESVGKRFGLSDITNCSVSRNQEQRRDQELLIMRRLKKSAKLDGDSSPAKKSPRLRFLEQKNKPTTSSAAVNAHSQALPAKKVAGGERFRSRLIKKPPQKSDIMRKNKQEARRSSTSIKKATGNIFPIKKPTGNIFPVKKDNSPPVTKIVVLQNQVCDGDGARGPRHSSSQLCGSLSQPPHTPRETLNGGAATAGAAGAQYDYVTRILNQKATRWFSPTHLLDPSLFHRLESHHPSTDTTTVTDRKLLFHLVDELLVGMLCPRVNTKHVALSELADTLCAKIGSFPVKECSVLGDIDEIVAGDLSEWEIRHVAELGYVEEGDRIVGDIEKLVIDALVYETTVVAMSLGRFGGDMRNGVVWVT